MLHAFYSPDDLDSALAAWAVQHALGDAVALFSGEGVSHSDMLLLNVPWQGPITVVGPIDVLSLQDTRRRIPPLPTAAGIKSHVVSRHQPCCLTAWEQFHASAPPMVIDLMDKTYGGARDPADWYNALLGVPWTMPTLSRFIAHFEDPQIRAHTLADGNAILNYRKLRADLRPGTEPKGT